MEVNLDVVKMKKIIPIIISVLMISLVLASDLGVIEDIKDLLTSDQKTEIADKYGSAEHTYLDCWNEDKCYTCKVQIGKPITTCGEYCVDTINESSGQEMVYCVDSCSTSPVLIEPISVCNFNASEGYTIEQRMELRIKGIVEAETKNRIITDDDQRLEGKTKDWNK